MVKQAVKEAVTAVERKYEQETLIGEAMKH